jgi:AcrR family transcriptional regulator
MILRGRRDAEDYAFFVGLSPTARRLLEAAHHVLLRDGYEGVTLGRVAAEAGETKSLIVYHFESKAGLVAKLVDFMWHDADVALAEQVERAAGARGRRLGALIGLHHDLAREPEGYRVLLDVLPAVARDEKLRVGLARFYAAYRSFGAKCVASEAPDFAEADALAACLLAVGEGIGIQALMLGGDAPLAAAFITLRRLVARTLGVETLREPGTGMPGPQPGRAALPPPVIADPADRLSPVALGVLSGGVALVRECGLKGLTIEAVAARSGQPRSSVSYSFGSKKRLVGDVFEYVLSRRQEGVSLALSALPFELQARVRRLVGLVPESLRRMDELVVFFEFLPALLRDEQLRRREALFTRWLLDAFTWAGVPPNGTVRLRDARGAAAATLALLHGLTIQTLVDPVGFDPAAPIALWERMLLADASRANSPAPARSG